jgi:hypothetical protein
MARAMEKTVSRDRASLEAAAVEAARALPTVLQEFESQLDLYRELLGKRGRS